MVLDHWSNDAMVSMDRCGLVAFDDDNATLHFIYVKVQDDYVERQSLVANCKGLKFGEI